MQPDPDFKRFADTLPPPSVEDTQPVQIPKWDDMILGGEVIVLEDDGDVD